MTSITTLPELILNLDIDNEPEEIFFYDPDNSFESNELIDMNVEKGKYALVLLILFTAISRRRNTTRTSKIQLPSKASEFTRTLTEAITNPSRDTKSAHWLVKIFGKNPNRVFFKAARLKKDVVYFLDNIKLTVHDYQDKDYSIDDLYEAFEDLLRNENQIAKKIDISVEVKATAIQRSYSITRNTSKGSVTLDSEIQIVVAPNYSTCVAIFWVCSEAEVYELFPKPDRDLKIPASKVRHFKLGSEIKIPENVYLPIDTVAGTETCIVVAGTSKFTAIEASEIAKLIKSTLGVWASQNTVGKPTFRVVKNKKRKKDSGVEEFRLGAPRTLDKWEQDLVGKFPSKVTSLSFLHIPNN